jgi:hypothetical protein
MAAPVAAAMASETPSAMSRRTGPTGSITGCLPIRIVWPSGKSERPEPEHVYVIRQRGPTTEEDDGKHDENEKEAAA